MGGGASKDGEEGEKRPRFSLKRSRKQKHDKAAPEEGEAQATVEVTHEEQKGDVQADAKEQPLVQVVGKVSDFEEDE